MIQCLILEDEQSAQEVLNAYIEKTPFINCLGIYESGLDVPQEELKQADILFLDIQLPELNGISFLKTLNNPPSVVVTSAYPNYAIEAFEEAVTDYLVKPFSYERFYKSVTRIRGQIDESAISKNNQVLLYTGKTTYRVDLNDILYLKAEVDYVSIVTHKRKILILDSLANWVDKLKTSPFKRIHRSYIVNLNHIEKIKGNLVFVENENEGLPIGRTYKQAFLDVLKKTGLF